MGMGQRTRCRHACGCGIDTCGIWIQKQYILWDEKQTHHQNTRYIMSAHNTPNKNNTIAHVHIIYDSRETVECSRFADFLADNGYAAQYQDICHNPNIDIITPDDRPLFLIGVGRAGNSVQNITNRHGTYAGGISIMSRVTVRHRFRHAFRFRFGRYNAPDIPLLMIGGWWVLHHMHAFLSPTSDEDKLDNLNILIYPDISFENMWSVAQDEILKFIRARYVQARGKKYQNR